jgi:hypothetical protein
MISAPWLPLAWPVQGAAMMTRKPMTRKAKLSRVAEAA